MQLNIIKAHGYGDALSAASVETTDASGPGISDRIVDAIQELTGYTPFVATDGAHTLFLYPENSGVSKRAVASKLREALGLNGPTVGAT